ncbi:putative oxidoreductase [Jatrophihabitans endophyticus]|uniref:Putative oxidoreductase n=1 Tax=Jatrophihabitans endophyticus TaxID=1206085 RepID=A0A1M5PUZ1_9ACTN|nr:DoxX family protein [Jatrophihabitans endophyticus]SHH05502.1 putative oxidoreductase [Jatrophihabitans endophyticus]
MTRRAPFPESADLARLLLRTAVGGTMIAHGVRHGRSLEGTARWFGAIGFEQPELQAKLSAVVEIGSGSAIVAGAVTPLSAAAVVGTMSVAIATVHRPHGYFVTAEGWEYTGFISAVSVALAALGSGRYSVDRLVGLDRVGTPGRRALLAAGLGVTGAVAQLAAFWRKPAVP